MSGTTSPPTELNSISFQGMPNLGVPLVNIADGTVALAWYRLLISMYNVTLAGLPTLPAGVSPSNPNSLTLAGVHSTTTDQSGQIGNIGTVVAGNVLSIATLTDDVVILQNEINALTARINTLQAQVVALQGQVDGMTVFAGTTGGANPGGAGPPPANVQAYMQIRLGATNFRVPLYNP